MIDEGLQEQAAAYALGALDADQVNAFEGALRVDPELRALVRELRQVSEALAGTVPALEPPAAIKARVLLDIDQQWAGGPKSAAAQPASAAPAVAAKATANAWIPWAIAAALAVLSVAFLWQSSRLRSQLAAQVGHVNELIASAELARAESADLRATVAQLRESDRIAKFRIAVLDSLLAADPKAVAVSVWDNDRQDGVFIVRNLKQLPGDKDYQLWIIDPKYPSPVSAGVFQIDAKGSVREDFHAKKLIQSANQFAVTIENKGGADVPNTKAMVLAGS
ncbi:MAG: anti-sigma factor [Steroidobacteraceae bacterium]